MLCRAGERSAVSLLGLLECRQQDSGEDKARIRREELRREMELLLLLLLQTGVICPGVSSVIMA
jgi:hypothetical protein